MPPEYEDLVTLIQRVNRIERRLAYLFNAVGLNYPQDEPSDKWKDHGPIKLNLSARIVSAEEDK